MVKTITISKQTQAFMDQLRAAEKKASYNNSTLPTYVTAIPHLSSMSLSEIIAWLMVREESYGDKDTPWVCETRFVRESLRASLLYDVHYALLTKAEKRKKNAEKKPSEADYFGVTMLAIAGTIFAICDGFDGVNAILSLFVAIPNWVVFVVGFAFSLLSIAVFYGFNLVEVSRNLGVQLNQSSQLLDVFVDQVEQIQQIRKQMKSLCKKKQAPETSQLLSQLQKMLLLRYQQLAQVRKVYTDDLNEWYLIALKFVIAGISGVLYFSYGFFASQSLALAILGLFFTSITATCWPVILIGVIVGLASLSIYWFVERPGLENLVGRWLGLDKDKIDVLADADEGQLNKLLALNATKKTPLGAHSLFKKSYSTGDLPSMTSSLGISAP